MPYPRFVRVYGRLLQRLVFPTQRGGWPFISAHAHRVAASIWLRFLTSNQYFGRTRLYQGYEPLELPGLRPSAERARVYRFDALIKPDARVLDIGCNMGCMTLEAARRARSVVGIEVDEDLLWIAETLRAYEGRDNARFLRVPFAEFEDGTGYDVVFAFAVHRWVGMPFADFVRKVTGLLVPGGALLFESNNYRRVAEEFEAEAHEILEAGFEVMHSGTTEYETPRKFYALRKVR